jgi:hypothetical protein
MDEGQNGSTDSLDIKTAIQIAKILAAAPDERIPMILDVFQKASVDINGLDELAEWMALEKQTALIDTNDFIKRITSGLEKTDGEYRIKALDFNAFCSENHVSARYARKHLYEHGLIRTSMDKGKINYTVPIWEKDHNERYVVIKDKENNE